MQFGQEQRQREECCTTNEQRITRRMCYSMSQYSVNTLCLPTLLVIFIMTTISMMNILPVQSFSTGAGSCARGTTAPVGGFHLEPNNPDGSKRTVRSGALSDGMVSVLINNNMDAPLVENTPYPLQTQTSYTITVVTTQEPGFKGILIRFANSDNTIDVPNEVLLDPSDASLLQLAEMCESETNTIGLTHVTNIAKLSVTTEMIFSAPGTIVLDVSLVGVNDAIASLYGHTGFVLQIEGDAVTASPTVAPTLAPVLPPGRTAAPSSSPTINDFVIDTLSPTYQEVLRSPSFSNNNSSVTEDKITTTTTSDAISLTSWIGSVRMAIPLLTIAATVIMFGP